MTLTEKLPLRIQSQWPFFFLTSSLLVTSDILTFISFGSPCIKWDNKEIRGEVFINIKIIDYSNSLGTVPDAQEILKISV